MKIRSSVKNQRKIISLVGIVSLVVVLASAFLAANNALFRNILHSYAAKTTGTGSWREDFDGTSLDTNFWTVSNDSYGMGAINNLHQGYFQPDRVSVNGSYLTIKLTQENGQVGTNPNGIISRGGEISSNKTYGYGTYEWNMRTSSTASSPTDTTGKVVSGQISSGFTYVNNSQTELDFEVEGQYPNQAEMTTWNNTHPSTDPTNNDRTETSVDVSGMANGFKTYKLVWSPGEVKYYVDDALVADHTNHVPSTPAAVIINEWGTDSTDFGGLATVGTARYLLVDWVRYTAPGDTPIPPSASNSQLTPPSPQNHTSTPTSTPIQTPNASPSSVSSNLIRNGSFDNGTLDPWYFNVTSGASGTASLDKAIPIDGNSSVRVDVTKSNRANDWYIQLGQNNIPLAQGHAYTITFWAKASKQRSGRLVIQQDDSPWTEYLSQNIPLATSWTKYSYTFTPTISLTNAEFNFNFAQTTGQVWIANVSMQEYQ